LRDGIELNKESLVQVTTNAGKSITQSGILPRLRFGDESFSHLPATLLQSQAATRDRTEDGLLPTCLFRVIFFNNKEEYVVLNPHKPK
ncbi:MAG: hypothetical protein ABR566_18130, partial [Pyrinomonadaceae bacterium]